MSFLLEHFCLNICYGNILLHFGLEGDENHKIKKRLFLPTPKISSIGNVPGMQLLSFFYKTVNRNKLKAWTFQSHRLSSFSAIKKTVTYYYLCLYT